jgi:hypothetical protein
MRIPRHNWDTGNMEDVEYPDELFRPFLVWLCTTSAWQEDHRRVEQQYRILERKMADYRNPPDSHREADAPPLVTAAEQVREKRRANLEKARAARRAKREAQHAAA